MSKVSARGRKQGSKATNFVQYIRRKSYINGHLFCTNDIVRTYLILFCLISTRPIAFLLLSSSSLTDTLKYSDTQFTVKLFLFSHSRCCSLQLPLLTNILHRDSFYIRDRHNTIGEVRFKTGGSDTNNLVSVYGKHMATMLRLN